MECKHSSKFGNSERYRLDELIKETVTNRNIVAARKGNKRVKTEKEIEYSPSETVVITFQGHILPQYVKLHYCRRKIEVPIYQSSYAMETLLEIWRH